MEKTNHSFILVGIIALNLLNLLDAHYTYTGVTEGYLEELNPIMDYLLVLGSVEFFACKLLLVLLATVFLYIRRSVYLLTNKIINISIFNNFRNF